MRSIQKWPSYSEWPSQLPGMWRQFAWLPQLWVQQLWIVLLLHPFLHKVGE